MRPGIATAVVQQRHSGREGYVFYSRIGARACGGRRGNCVERRSTVPRRGIVKRPRDNICRRELAHRKDGAGSRQA